MSLRVALAGATALAVAIAAPPAMAQDPTVTQTVVPPPTVAACQNRRTLVAVAQGVGVNLVINRANAWLVEDGDFAKVDFQSWMENLRYGWQWDETQFTVNMFAHPYHGALYFDAARANCLTFWESIPLTFLGSWAWEFLGERWRPSLNDFWMTGFGGIALGEMLHRISAAIIDERATGSERIVREIGATMVNPTGGLNRLVRGQWRRQGPNPVDRHPTSYLFRADVGGRRVEEAGSSDGRTHSPTLLLDVVLGDPFDTPYSAPFDVTTMLAQVSPDGGGLNILRASGRLWGRELTAPESWHRHQLAIRQRFDYVHNPAYRFGAQGLEVAVLSRWRTGPGDLRVSTSLAGEAVLLGAMDALDGGAGGRTIDFGPGVGATVEISVERNGNEYLTLYNRVRYLRSVSGAPADHTILFSGLELNVPITRQLGIGTYLSGDRRQSYYAEFPDDARTYRETRIFLTWTFDQRVAGRSR